MTVHTFNPNAAELIDVLQLDNSEAIDNQYVADLFNESVSNTRKIIESTKVIPFILCSMGKDSSCTLLIALEAYRQSIAEGKIEPERPFIVSTVNTLAEQSVMVMYVSYARQRLLSYAKKHNINLRYDIVTPAMDSEFFIRFCGGQKLLPSVARNGECTSFLKITPSKLFAQQILQELKTDYDSAYSQFDIVMCIGSRQSESLRRSNNLHKQQLAGKYSEQLIQEIKASKGSGGRTFNYAPIISWATSDVLKLLTLAGDKPLVKGASPVPGFLNNFGLLVEIYGDGAAAEVCEIAVGETEASAGRACSGKARFGCSMCTISGVKDKSSTGLASLKRWRSIGAQDALRVRDWLYRVSSDMGARALHARAFDSVGFNRVGLQGNILKPKYLEKMVRYASQLSLDSIRISEEFTELVKQGRELEHEGYREIANDPLLAPKIKREFLAMYKESLQDPRNLNILFSEKHAIYLSFRWSLDGVGSAPFKPLAIWEQLKRGEGWIPYPALNSELKNDELKKIQGYESLADPVMIATMKNEDPQEHVFNHTSFLSLWSRPTDVSDVVDEEMNCSINRVANATSTVQVEFESTVTEGSKTGRNNLDSIKLERNGQSLVFSLEKPLVTKVMLNGKLVHGHVKNLLLKKGLESEVQTYCITHFHNALKVNTSDINIKTLPVIFSKCNGTYSIAREVNYLKSKSINTGYTNHTRQSQPKLHFSQRVTKLVKGNIVRGNSRMVFYPLQADSSLHEAHKQEEVMYEPHFDSHTQKHLSTHDNDLFSLESEMKENIKLDEGRLAEWKQQGGVEAALELHDSYLKRLIKYRHVRRENKKSVRRYSGTQAVEILMSHGVISIAKRYLRQFNAVFKRTQILDSLGMFEFQSMSIDKVKDLPCAISMAQHRKDKVNVLNVIRAYRQEQRKAITKALSAGPDISATIGFVERGVTSVLNTCVHAFNATQLKMHFDTHSIPVSERANASLFWLAYYFDGLATPYDFIRKILPQKMVIEYKADPALQIAFTREVVSLLGNVNKQINSTLTAWEAVEVGMVRFLGSEYATSELAKQSYVEHVFSNAPFGADKQLLAFWNPNVTTMKSDVRRILKSIKEKKVVLQGLSKGINSVTAKGSKRVVGAMTLAQKLSLMS